MDYRRTERIGLPAGTWMRTRISLHLARVVNWDADGDVYLDILTPEAEIYRTRLHHTSLEQATPTEEELAAWAIATLSR